MRLFLVHVAAGLAALGLPSGASAHLADTATLGAVALDSSGEITVAQTSLGLAIRRNANEFGYGCASAHGGIVGPPAAALGQRIAVAARIGPMLSSEGGCNFEPLSIQVPGTWEAVGVQTGGIHSGGVQAEGKSFIFLVNRTDTALGAAAVETQQGGSTELLSLWSAARADHLAAFHVGDSTVLFASGSAPKPWARAAERTPTGWRWTEIALPVELSSAQPTSGDTTRLEVRYFESGEMWIAAVASAAPDSTDAEWSLWRGTYEPKDSDLITDGSLNWSLQAKVLQGIAGPIAWQGARWIVHTLQLWKQPEPDAEFSSLGVVDWGCLQMIGPHAFACRPREIVRLSPPTALAGLPGTESAFNLNQFVHPDPECSRKGAAKFECDAHWDFHASIAELLPKPAELEEDTNPNPPPNPSLGGCQQASPTPQALIWLTLVAILAMWPHHRRRAGKA